MHDYSPSLNSLLTRGEPSRGPNWPHYLTDLTEADVPDLIRMATDLTLHTADGDSPEVWAPVHAWRALGQLRAVAAVEPLAGLFGEHDLEDDDWVHEELPEVFVLMGPDCLPALARFLGDRAIDRYGRSSIADTMAKIGNQYPDARGEAVRLLAFQLERAEDESPELNGFVIAALLDLHGIEALPMMQRAFEADAVDCSIAGDWYVVLSELGLYDDAKDREWVSDDERRDIDTWKSAAAPRSRSSPKQRKAKRKRAAEAYKRYCKAR